MLIACGVLGVMLCLRFASPLPALAALTPLRRPATGSSGSITTSLVTRAICSTPPFARFTARATSSAALVVGATSDALTSDWFGGKPKRPFSSSAFRGSSFGPTDEFLQFMRRYHEQANGLQPPTDHDMLHWKPSIHAVQETIKREGKPGGFIHYIVSGGEVITPAHGSVISEEHVLMLQISQEQKDISTMKVSVEKIARAVDSLNANVNTIQQHLTTLQKDVNDRKKAEASGGGGGGGASLGYYGLLLAAQCLCIAALLYFKSRGAKREHLL